MTAVMPAAEDADRRAVVNRQSPIPTIRSGAAFSALSAGAASEHLSTNLIIQLGLAPKDLAPFAVRGLFFALEGLGLRNRTPAPPPFSSINSIPAASSAFCSISRASSDTCGPNAPSMRLTVGRESPARDARSV